MQYNKSFKEEAVWLSGKIGPQKVAEQLGISYHWPIGSVRNIADCISVFCKKQL